MNRAGMTKKALDIKEHTIRPPEHIIREGLMYVVFLLGWRRVLDPRTRLVDEVPVMDEAVQLSEPDEGGR